MGELPLVGNALADAGAFIERIRNEVIPGITEILETAPELAAKIFADVGQVLQEALTSLGYLGSAVKLEFDGGGIGKVIDFSALDLALLESLLPAAREFSFVIDLDIDLELKPDDVNLNLEVFALQITDPITVDLEVDFTFGIGVSLDDGFFFQVDPDDPDLGIALGVSLPDSLNAQLFLVQLTALNQRLGEKNLDASFTVDVTGADENGRIGFADLGGIGFDVDFGAAVALDFALDLGVANTLDESSGRSQIGFPSVEADLEFAWGFGSKIDADHPESPLLALSDINLDIGSFLKDTIGPFLEDLYDVLAPIDPLIDTITDPIPVLSDLFGPTSLLDVASTFGLVDPSLVTALEVLDQLLDFAEQIDGISAGKFEIIEGRISLGGGGGLDLRDINQVGGLIDPSKAFDEILSALGGLGIDLPDAFADIGDFITSGFSPAEIAGEFGGVPGLNDPEGGFSFPFLEDYSQVLGLFFGRNLELVAFDLPPLSFGFDFSVYVPIWGPLGARFAGGINATIDLAFGYDTEGVFRFVANDGRNALDLAQGFFIYDDNPFGG
ncbi:MAG: hypothetical protein WCF04_01255, partial [Candidatus Nanopelagicales bacterium]